MPCLNDLVLVQIRTWCNFVFSEFQNKYRQLSITTMIIWVPHLTAMDLSQIIPLTCRWSMSPYYQSNQMLSSLAKIKSQWKDGCAILTQICIGVEVVPPVPSLLCIRNGSFFIASTVKANMWKLAKNCLNKTNQWGYESIPGYMGNSSLLAYAKHL
jgi:hypothetical protein